MEGTTLVAVSFKIRNVTDMDKLNVVVGVLGFACIIQGKLSGEWNQSEGHIERKGSRGS